MTERVKTYIEQHQLLSHEKGACLVALSGGADSVCLLLVLRQLGYDVEAVHCNFKLRGDESERDEQFVIALCKDHRIKLHLTHFDTRTYASLHKVSIEMAARQLRYSYFEQLRSDIDAQAICVAHHQDDAVETILMNLIRGTGLHGLTGIKPRNGHVVRPLLCISRQEIEQWLKAQGQAYIIDTTNLIPDVVRNKLRLQVLPLLHDITPSATTNILTTARRLAEAERVYDKAVDEQLEKLINADSIDIRQLLMQPSPEALLFEWLTPFGFTPATIEAISQRLPEAQAGRQWLSPTHQLTIHQGCLVLDTIRHQPSAIRIPEPGTYLYNDEEARLRIELSKGCHILRDAHTACLDAAKVSFPLTLRPVQTGDRFQPFGMKGTKLVSDYLTDRHVPLNEKRRQLVLTDAQGQILWLVGHRPDGHFTVNDDTTETLIISSNVKP